MRVDVWPYYSVDRPPVKFHRIQSPFDAPTDNYSGSIADLSSDVFGLRKQMSGPLSLSSHPRSLATVHLVHPPTPLRVRSRPMRSHGPKPSLHSASNPSRASGSCPGPDPLCHHHCLQIIPKHLQNITVFLFGLPNYFFLRPSDCDRRDVIAPTQFLAAIYSR